jgi:glycosyltransferase involved in cell wall biosynthesis
MTRSNSSAAGGEGGVNPPLQILYVQYTDPAGYPPLEHGALLLAEAGCEAHFIGVDLMRGAVMLASHPRITTELMAGSPPGWRQKLHAMRFIWRVIRAARVRRPDWIYASDALSTPAVVALRWVSPARVVYHEHDAPPRMAISWFARLVLWCRARTLRRASVVVVPNESRAQLLGTTRPVVLVRNTALRREVAPHRAGIERGRLRLLYHGSLVPARLPMSVIDAVARLPEGVTLTIAGYDPAGGQHLAALVERASVLGVARRVVFSGTVPTRSALLELARTCDVGLAFMPSDARDPNEASMAGASNKPFDYLACGLALLVSDVPAWRDMFVQPGYGLACRPESIESLTRALTWCLEHPESVRDMGQAGGERVLADWHYEREFSPVMAEILGSAAPADATTLVARAAVGGT